MFPLYMNHLRPPLGDDNRLYWDYANSYASKVLGYSPIAYWPLWEASGATAGDESGNGFDGTYTGVTLGETGIGDGRTCPYFDGANDHVDVFSAGLAGAFDGAEVTIINWLKPNTAAVWDDGTKRKICRFYDDANNRVYMENDGAETAAFATRGAGTWSSVLPSSAAFGALWQLWAITRSETDDEVKAYRYVDGVGGQTGATLGTLGAFAGAITIARLGSLDGTPTQPWHGWLAHAQVYDSALPIASIADLAVV